MVQFSFYNIPLVLVLVIIPGLALIVWQRRPSPGVIPFVWLMISVTVWTTAYNLELMINVPEIQKVLILFEYLGITSVPAWFLVFVIEYSGYEKLLTRRRLLLFAIQPVLVFVLIATNNSHHLFFSRFEVHPEGTLNVLWTVKGPLFWAHAAYSYVLILSATVLLIRALLRSPQLYRGQVIFLLVGVFAPWVANIISLSGLSPLPWFDLTPLSFAMTGVAFGWSLLRFRLMDIVPVARDKVIESMSDAMFVLDLQGRIVDVNPAALRALGLSASSEIIGKPAREVLAAYQKLLDQFRDVNEAQAEIAVGPEGPLQRHYELNISPLRARNGTLTGRVVVLHNISVLKQASERIKAQNETLVSTNRELAAAQTRAEEANRIKSEFLATMSHELRTPLNAIIGYTDLMLTGAAGAMTEAQTDYMSRVLANGERLLAIINDILDISRIEAGRLELENKPFSPSTLLSGIQTQLRSLADKKALNLTAQLDPTLDVTLMGDQKRLEQILTNLVGNALRFTDKGGVDVRFAKHLEQPEKMWTMIVTDTGVGIPPHALDYIFDEFRQVDGSTQRQYGGTGLGLAIVRKLAVLMGGTVNVQSEVGRGSTFTVQLPLKIAQMSPQIAPVGQG